MRSLAIPLFVLVQVAAALPQSQEAKLLPRVRRTSMIFGYTTAFDGRAALVGATFEQIGQNANAGAAYLYEPVDGEWIQTDRFSAASDRHTDDFFGSAVAIDGDLIAIGANNADADEINNSGATYVFERADGAWTRTQKLVAPTPTPGWAFGAATAVWRDQIFVGAPAEDHSESEQAGTVFVYEKDANGAWQIVQTLIASDAQSFGFFGAELAVDEDLLVVGAQFSSPGGMLGAGQAYIFRRIAGVWVEEGRLVASDVASMDNFGVAVAVAGERVLVGAERNDLDGIESAGAAYVFERAEDAWQETTRLTAPAPFADDRFGVSVALTGTAAIVGAFLDDNELGAGAGSAFVYRQSEAGWSYEHPLLGADTVAGDVFGWSLAARGGTALVSAPFDELNLGAAYIFSGIGGCPEDLDQNGAVDSGDLATLLSQYGQSGKLSGDLDGDGQVSVSDLAAILSAYGTGCG